jgi:hypothetical protein
MTDVNNVDKMIYYCVLTVAASDPRYRTQKRLHSMKHDRKWLHIMTRKAATCYVQSALSQRSAHLSQQPRRSVQLYTLSYYLCFLYQRGI